MLGEHALYERYQTPFHPTTQRNRFRIPNRHPVGQVIPPLQGSNDILICITNSGDRVLGLKFGDDSVQGISVVRCQCTINWIIREEGEVDNFRVPGHDNGFSRAWKISSVGYGFDTIEIEELSKKRGYI